MNTIRNIVLATLTVATLVSACAINSARAEGITYLEAVRACGAEWKVSEAKKNVVKGTGQKAWNDFRAKCVVDKGYTVKRGKKSAVATVTEG